MKTLGARASLALIVLAVLMGLLLFVPAGTVHYWQAWVYLSIFTCASALTTLDLMRRDPALLERRMSGGPFAEKEPAQKLIMFGTSLGFIGLLVLPAVDHRLGWSDLPGWAAIAGDVIMLLGWLGIFFVFRENSFASATIESAADQRVISSGPYAWVRHPMYAAALVMLLGMPLALGSAWGVLLVLALVPLLIWRLMDEERFLVNHLPGYREYQGRVRYRLLPLIW